MRTGCSSKPILTWQLRDLEGFDQGLQPETTSSQLGNADSKALGWQHGMASHLLRVVPEVYMPIVQASQNPASGNGSSKLAPRQLAAKAAPDHRAPWFGWMYIYSLYSIRALREGLLRSKIQWHLSAMQELGTEGGAVRKASGQ